MRKVFKCKTCGQVHNDELDALRCHPKIIVIYGDDLPEARRPSPRPAVRSAIELLRTIRNAGDVEMDDFSDEFWQEVDAVLKTAGGG